MRFRTIRARGVGGKCGYGVQSPLVFLNVFSFTTARSHVGAATGTVMAHQHAMTASTAHAAAHAAVQAPTATTMAAGTGQQMECHLGVSGVRRVK